MHTGNRFPEVLQGLEQFFRAAVGADDKVTIRSFGDRLSDPVERYPKSPADASATAQELKEIQPASTTLFQDVVADIVRIRRSEQGQLIFVIASDFAHDNQRESCGDPSARIRNFEAGTSAAFSDASGTPMLLDGRKTTIVMISAEPSCKNDEIVSRHVKQRLEVELHASAADGDAAAIARTLLTKSIHATVRVLLDPVSALGPNEGKLHLLATNHASAFVVLDKLAFKNGTTTIFVPVRATLQPCKEIPLTITSHELQQFMGQSDIDVTATGDGIDEANSFSEISFRAIEVGGADVVSYRPYFAHGIWTLLIELRVASHMRDSVTFNVDASAIGGTQKQYTVSVEPGTSYFVLAMPATSLTSHDKPATGNVSLRTTDETQVIAPKNSQVDTKANVPATEHEEELPPLLKNGLYAFSWMTALALFIWEVTGTRRKNLSGMAKEAVHANHYKEMVDHTLGPLIGAGLNIVTSRFSPGTVGSIDYGFIFSGTLRFLGFFVAALLILRHFYIRKWETIENTLFENEERASDAYRRVRRKLLFFAIVAATVLTVTMMFPYESMLRHGASIHAPESHS